METKRQIYFRMYGEHISECVQCRVTPRSEANMCQLGRDILVQYRDEMNKDLAKVNKAEKMTMDELAQTLSVLQDKEVKNPDDQNMIDAIDHLIRVRLEREYAK